MGLAARKRRRRNSRCTICGTNGFPCTSLCPLLHSMYPIFVSYLVYLRYHFKHKKIALSCKNRCRIKFVLYPAFQSRRLVACVFIFQLFSFLIVSTQFDFYLVIVSVIKITVVGKLSTFVDELQRPEELLGDNGSAIKLGSMMARWARLNLYGR